MELRERNIVVDDYIVENLLIIRLTFGEFAYNTALLQVMQKYNS
jgi:hypothetical protein